MEEKIRANAELVRNVARENLDVEVGYDEEGVRWLDGYINRQRENNDDQSVKDRLPSRLGSFLGECIRNTFGGDWIEGEKGWGVKINEELTVYPFNKVRKQLSIGGGDSVLAFFKVIPALLELQSKSAVAVKKPWWKFW